MSQKNKMSLIARWVGFCLAVLVTAVLAVALNRGGFKKREYREVSGYTPWSEEVIEIAKRIPVQDGGRVKPFETRAGFLMLKFHGARSMKIENGNGEKIKIGPTEWLLDILYRPKFARDMPTFEVNDSNLLESVGVDAGKRRDHYSYADLEPGLQKLGKMAGDVQKMVQKGMQEDPDYKFPKGEPDPRTLASMIMEYHGLLGIMDFARLGLTLDESAEIGNPEDMAKVSYWVKILPHLGEILRSQGLATDGKLPPQVEAVLGEIEFLMDRGQYGLAWIPPYEATVTVPDGEKIEIYSGEAVKTFEISCEKGEVSVFEGRSKLGVLKAGSTEKHPAALLSVKAIGGVATIKVRGNEWMSVGSRWTDIAKGLDPNHFELLANDIASLEGLHTAASGKESEFVAKLESWKEEMTKRAAGLGVGGGIESEVAYYKRDYFLRGAVFFILAFLLAAVSWLSPGGRFGKGMTLASWILGSLGLLLVVSGIIHRCILMGRPPVGNLYDTIPFITAGGMIVLLLLELKTRRRMALGAALAIGMLGMFLARMFEGVDAKDHMDPLRAVLRSNFWLATHVIIITIGYAGGLIAAAMSHVYLYARAFGLDKSDPTLRRFLTRSVYGLVCFTLFFSLVGTVLGGIWANDSWGRFWGWDPKENGAMLIVLWSLIILHARMGGYLKEWGLHIASVLGAIVVAFSWWGVNLLGTGLHSYGFTDGIGTAVKTFYYFEFAVALGGLGLALYDRLSKKFAREAKNKLESLEKVAQ